MKRIVSGILATALTLSLAAMPTLALSEPQKSAETYAQVTPRYASTQRAAIDSWVSGGKVYCQLDVKAFSSSTAIKGTLKLSGNGFSKSWPISGTGSVDVVKSTTPTKKGTYAVTFSGTCGSDDIDLDAEIDY